jgi:hypothetical protein
MDSQEVDDSMVPMRESRSRSKSLSAVAGDRNDRCGFLTQAQVERGVTEWVQSDANHE